MFFLFLLFFFFFKQKTAYVMRIIDWSSDVCSSDLCLSNTPDWLHCTGARPTDTLISKTCKHLSCHGYARASATDSRALIGHRITRVCGIFAARACCSNALRSQSISCFAASGLGSSATRTAFPPRDAISDQSILKVSRTTGGTTEIAAEGRHCGTNRSIRSVGLPVVSRLCG